MFERSLVLFEEVGDSLGVAYARFGLGRVASLENNQARSAEQFGEALALRREFGDRRGIVECVEAIAGVALVMGEIVQAAKLFSATSAARFALGVPIPPVYRPALDAQVESLRSALGQAAFALAWDVGEVMTIDHAAAEAAAIARSWQTSLE